MHVKYVLCAGVLSLGATASAEQAASPEGAWASGQGIEACDTGPITLFMSDGVVAVFLTKSGGLHSLGAWSLEDNRLTMTHNDFPLPGSGQSDAPVVLDILKLDAQTFVTRNKDGQERSRVRCSGIEISNGQEHAGH